MAETQGWIYGAKITDRQFLQMNNSAYWNIAPALTLARDHARFSA
jgi:hypothetical protein